MLWFCLYMLCMFAISLRNLSSKQGKDEYFVCGRKARAPMVAFSLLASCIGGSATIGMIGLAWQSGWPALWWLGSGAVGLGLLGLLLARKVRATRSSTLPEIVNSYLGAKCCFMSSIIVLLSSIAIVAAQFNALGLLLSSLAGLPLAPAAGIGAAAIWAYTFLGGQTAVMKSDIWQFLALAASILLALFFLLKDNHCAQALASAPFELVNNSFPPRQAIYFLLIFGSSFLIGPMLFGRLLSARSLDTARSATLWAAWGLAAMAFLIAATGIAISGLNITPASREDALFSGIHAVMPEWASIAITLGLISAVVSSADSCLLTAATVWSNDIRKGGGVRETRLAMTFIAITSYLLIFCGKGILGLLLAASDIYVCGIVCPLFVALLAGVKTRSVFYPAAIVAGGLCGLAAALSGLSTWSYLGLGLSLLLACAGMLGNYLGRGYAS